MKKNKFGKLVKYYKFNYDIFKEDNKMEEKPDLKEVYKDYMELVETLHNEMDNISKNVQTKIWDMVYKRFEP